MKDLHKADAARKIAALSEEKVKKVLAFMDEVEAGRGGKNSRRPGMRRTALAGLRGRRRDTALLWTVIVLAFLFLALPTTLITSLNATDAASRKETYGKWQVMAADLTRRETEELAAAWGEGTVCTPLVEVSGTDWFQGDNAYTLGVYSPELAELGSFQLREGRWPEAEDEVVLEYARLASLDLELGDSFTVQVGAKLPMTAERAAANVRAIEEERQAQRERMTELFYHGDWEIIHGGDNFSGSLLRVGEESFWLWGGTSSWMDNQPVELQREVGFLYWWGNYCPQSDSVPGPWYSTALEDLTDEQFVLALDYYLDNAYVPDYIAACTARGNDLLGVDGISVRLSFTGGPGVTEPLDMGAIPTYTVCGVIDTYTDHWDSGDMTLPGGFITRAGYEKLQACQRAVLEKYPQFEAADGAGLVLRESDGTAQALWEDSIAAYDRTILGRAEFAQPVYWVRYAEQIVDENGYTEGYAGCSGQLGLGFVLADPERPLRSEAVHVGDAWLIPASCQGLVGDEWVSGEEYVYDRPLSEGLEGSGDQMLPRNSGRLDQLVETEEDQVVLTDDYVYQISGDGQYSMTSMSCTLAMDLDGARVAFDLEGRRYEIPLEDFVAGNFSVNGLVPMDWDRGVWLDDPEQEDFSALRCNRFAYPASAEGLGPMLGAVMGMLFVTTVCAVFQICFTQIRRRMKRIVLLKALGAEAKQIGALMAWEFLYIWAGALPIGTGLGLGGAYLAVKILSWTQERRVLLFIEPGVLLSALAAGTLALALGMMIPAVMAVGVPLTGRTVRRKPLPPPKRDVRQDFFHVSLRGLAAKKGRTIGVFALCAFMMTITLLCLFLGFRFLGEYRDTVIRDGKPDYLLRSPYAMSLRQRNEYLEELEELGVCGEVTSYFVGEDIGLDRSAWEESFLLTLAAGEAESYPVDLYTLSSDDALFSAFQAAATEGQLDPAAFDDGREVLLAVPLYRDTGKVNEAALETARGWDRVRASGVETTFLPEYDGIFQRDEAVRVGDTIRLATESSRILENESYATAENGAEVRVGAVLYYFPDTGLWPISGQAEGYQLVASPRLLKTLLPSAVSSMLDESVRAISVQQNTLRALGGVYGATDFYITAGEGVEQEKADTALLIFARNHYMDIEVYHEGSTALLRNAVSNILLACLLGMSAVLLALVIFYNTISSDIEQERPRIGILQSLGVSSGRFAARQAVIGGAASAIAVAVANAVVWGGVILFVCATGTVLGNLLWGYPTAWHVCLCAALACILIFLFVLPMGRVGRYLPVENIRSKD